MKCIICAQYVNFLFLYYVTILWALGKYEFGFKLILMIFIVLLVGANPSVTSYLNEAYAESKKFQDEKRSCEVLQKESKNNPKDNNTLENNGCAFRLDFTDTISVTDSVIIVKHLVTVPTDTIAVTDSVKLVHTSVLSETDPIDVGGNSTSTDKQNKSCESLLKENNGKSAGNENAIENNDCEFDDGFFEDLELFLNEFTEKETPPRGPPSKPKIIKYGSITAAVRPLYTTVDDPANHIVGPGGYLDGVGKLLLNRIDGTFICSGSLLPTGEHVLTAAHCVTDENGIINLFAGTVTFFGNSGTEKISLDATRTVVPMNWDGDYLRGNDIAVIKLVNEASRDITRYDIDNNKKDDVGAIGEKAGFGASGTGDTGWTFFDGQERVGKNKYDDFADVWLKLVGFKPGKDFDRNSVLMYDFDNGLAKNDAFGVFFGNSDLGLGIEEVSSAPGDSGGPTIVDGKITGVTSYILSLTVGSKTPDVTGKLDSSFGEFSADTRVSEYGSFINSAMKKNSQSYVSNYGLSDEIDSILEEFDDLLDGVELEVQLEAQDNLDDVELAIEELESLLGKLNGEEDSSSQAVITFAFETNESDHIIVGDALVTVDEETNNFLELDGDGDYLMMTNDTSTNYLTGFTITARIQPDYSNGSPEFTIISKENSFVLSLNNIIEPQKIAKFSIFDGIKWTTVESDSIINEEWTSIAATFNGETIMIYVNGELEGTQQVTGLPIISVNGKLKTVTVDGISSDSDIVIGAYLNTNRGEIKIQNQFSGIIDYVLLYDTVLDQTQIYEIYYNATPTNVI